MFRLTPLPDIVTNFLLKCGPIHREFSSTHKWDLVLAGNLCPAPLPPNQYRGFSPLLTLLLYQYHGPKSATNPALLDKGFSLFQDILLFINGYKWFLMLVCHPTYYSSAIVFQGLSFLKDQMTASNLKARWQDPTIQTAPASYPVLYLMHNLFTTISAAACNITQSSRLPTMITVPTNKPSFLISPTIKDATLTIYLNVTIQKWCSTYHSTLTGLSGAASSLISLLQVSQSVTLSHYLFRFSKKRPPTY